MIYKIERDTFPLNPRDEENIGTIAFVHNRYVSGDTIVSSQEIEDLINNQNIITLPVYAYIHGSISLNTTGFNCPWDSGQIGCIYVTKNKIRDVYNTKRVTKTLVEKVKSVLRAEIEICHNFINDEVYGYVISDDSGNILQSCWGYYGYEDAENAAKEIVAT
jgi:hypothetical protein